MRCDAIRIGSRYVSTEVDARLSFDKDGSLEKARKLIKMSRKNPRCVGSVPIHFGCYR